ncbi:hypothetical protein BDD43_4905 [Mucilaginibacter gracilis]|uniref:Uncharacterized protein n=1 Tax=Mucilaginibacter gracilis TaxID=423350 RepID=A0A495J6N4_9SPHI|nr:hypothetical protein [Mucilaginibacter gracilis]RKR84656.1 hypothetical protein BDD43_4905 [Mucilaginibacter gracilis]
MGYIREPKNVDLVVGPSILTEDTKKHIAQAIAQYHKTGRKPVSVEITQTAGSASRAKSTKSRAQQAMRRKAKI